MSTEEVISVRRKQDLFYGSRVTKESGRCLVLRVIFWAKLEKNKLQVVKTILNEDKLKYVCPNNKYF